MRKESRIRKLLKPFMVLVALIIGFYAALIYALGELRDRER